MEQAQEEWHLKTDVRVCGRLMMVNHARTFPFDLILWLAHSLRVVARVVIEISRFPSVRAVWVRARHAPADRFVHVDHCGRALLCRTRDTSQTRVEDIVSSMQL